MNANSLKWFENTLQAQRALAAPGTLHGGFARALQAWNRATQSPPRVPDMVLALNEQAHRYEATQPGYAADLRFAAQRALQAHNNTI